MNILDLYPIRFQYPYVNVGDAPINESLHTLVVAAKVGSVIANQQSLLKEGVSVSPLVEAAT